MIKRTLKNYLSNLKYIFTPIGVLTIFVLIGLSIVFTNVSNALSTMISEIQKLLEAQTVDYNAAKDTAINRVLGLDWINYTESFQTLTSEAWLTDVLNESAQAAFPNSEEFVNQITQIVQTCIATILLNMMILLVLFLAGIIVGYMVLKFLITREMVKRSFIKSILKALLHTIVNITIIALVVFLISLFKVKLMINLIITFFLYFIINLFESYLLYGVKKIPFKKAFNFKAMLFLVLSSFLVAGITVGLCFAFRYLFHPIASFIFIVTLVQIAIVTNELLGESYIQSLLQEMNNNISSNENESKEEPGPAEEIADSSINK